MYGFKAFVFNGKKTASKAYDALEEHKPVYPWIDDAAVVSKNKLGFTRVHSTWAQDDTAVGVGTGLGVMTGALLGAILGPGAAAAGAAVGGSVGAVSSAVGESVLSDPRLDDFAASLANDTSALILVGERASILDFTSAVAPYGGKIIETNLNEKDVKALRQLVKK
jgi:uncharacterized membrane protein